MHDVIADPAGSAWSFGGSILTFAFPMILSIVVAAALYILYTKPEFVPGHRRPGVERRCPTPRSPGSRRQPPSDRPRPPRHQASDQRDGGE